MINDSTNAIDELEFFALDALCRRLYASQGVLVCPGLVSDSCGISDPKVSAALWQRLLDVGAIVVAGELFYISPKVFGLADAHYHMRGRVRKRFAREIITESIAERRPRILVLRLLHNLIQQIRDSIELAREIAGSLDGRPSIAEQLMSVSDSLQAVIKQLKDH